MTDKLTDSEIVKALPKVRYGGHGCKNCKYDNGKGDDRCGLKGCKIARYALDLINRLQAENKELKKELAKPILATKDLKVSFERIYRIGGENAFVQALKAEAYKECIEKMKEKAFAKQKTLNNEYLFEFDGAFLDNLLKELVGEDNTSFDNKN